MRIGSTTLLVALFGYMFSMALATDAQPAATPIKPTQIGVDPATGTSILKWKDGKRVAFYLAFDDACPTDLTNVIPALEEHKIVGTFYVIAGGGLFKDRPEWVKVSKSPYVVLANHTLNHKDFPTIEKFETEIIEANKLILKSQPGKPDRLISFGKPGGVKYGITDAQILEVLAKHNLIDRLPFWGSGIHVNGTSKVIAYVDAAIKKGELSHLDFHGVGGDWLVTPLDVFHALLDKLDASSDLMWISDAATVQKYLAERKAAELTVIEKTDTLIRLKLTTKTDQNQYDVPLTLATKVPASWKSVEVTQGQTHNNVTVTGEIAKYDVLPNGIEVVLTPGK